MNQATNIMRPKTKKTASAHPGPAARFVEIKIDPNASRGTRQTSTRSIPSIIEEMSRLDWVTCPVWMVTGRGELTLAGWMS